MPFAEEFRQVYDHGIRPAAENAGFQCYRGDDPVGPRNIVADIIEGLFAADAIIADLTSENANVFYELGIAHSIANKTIMICQRTQDRLPFDLVSYRTVSYDATTDGIDNLRQELEVTLQNLDSWTSKRTNPVQDFRPVHYSVPLSAQADLEQRLRETEAELTRVRSEAAGKPEIGEMVIIPSGEFPMGSTDGETYERPLHDVFTDAFAIDVYPATNGEFREFVRDFPEWTKRNAIDQHKNVYYLFDWPEDSYPRGKRNHPVVWVNWYAAVAYCNWRSRRHGLEPCYDEGGKFACSFTKNGYRLPTEAEFEKAARGGAIGSQFPWGMDIDISKANFDNAVGDVTEVGTYPPNGYGLYDIAGNVKQWCNDWFDADYYDKSPKKNPCGPKKGDFRVFRGGSWGSDERELRCAHRAWLLPPNTNPDFGFRCVRKP